MIERFNVIVTSTIFPKAVPSKLVSVFSPEERLSQTIETVESLKKLGYQKIYLFDNSGTGYQSQLENAIQGVIVKTFDHFQFDNKGISEAFLLLAGLQLVSDNNPVMKISGRYSLEAPLAPDFGDFDLAAKFYEHKDRKLFFRETMATRCYCCKNKVVFEKFIREMLEQIYAYPSRIYGIGSIWRLLTNQRSKRSYSFLNSNLSVEAASVSAIRALKLSVCRLEAIGLVGQAGTFSNLNIRD